MMPINETSKFEKILQGGIQDNLSTSILKEVDLLIKKFESKCIYNIDIKLEVITLIQKLDEMANLPLTREALGRLLKLKIEDCQKLVIEALKISIHQIYLGFDVEKQQSKEIVQLEQYVSDAISQSLDSNSVEIFFSLIDLYEIILERLWLLSLLSNDRSSYAIIVEQNAPNIIEKANRWLIIASKQYPNEEKIQKTISILDRALKRIILSPNIFEEVSRLKQVITKTHLFILTYIADIYLKIGEFQKAANYYRIDLNLFLENSSLLDIETHIRMNLGKAYIFLGEIDEALKCYSICHQIAKKKKNTLNQIIICLAIGSAHYSKGNNLLAIECYEEILEAVLTHSDKNLQMTFYINLANPYASLGNYIKAIELHKKCLDIAISIPNEKFVGIAYANLADLYSGLGNYIQAIQFENKSLEIAISTGNQLAQEVAYSGLASIYKQIGEYSKSISYCSNALKIAERINNQEARASIYGELGDLYRFIEDMEQSIKYYKQSLRIAQEIKNRPEEASALYGMGQICFAQGNYKEAIKYYEQSLKIITKIDRELEAEVNSAIGNAYFGLDLDLQAIKYYKESLEINQKIGNRKGQAINLADLGLAYKTIDQFDQSEQYFYQSIEIFSTLEQELKDHNQLKISIFEEQSKAYIRLEKLLLKKGKTKQALEISEARRSRTLVSILSKKCPALATSSSIFIKCEEIQALASKLNTVFVFYSFPEIIVRRVFNPKNSQSRLISMNEIQGYNAVWVITQNSIDCKMFSSFDWTEEMYHPIKLFQTYPYNTKEIPKTGYKLPSEAFQDRLTKWYETLILPIEDYLPKRSDQTLTFVTEGLLSQLPFAAFCDKDGKYLIEKYPIAITPSIKVLELLSNIPHTPSYDSLVIGNPFSPDPAANKLMRTESETRYIVAELLKTTPENILTKTAASVSDVIKKLPFAKWVHLACHGELGDKPVEKLDIHSIFDGFFRLAGDESYPTGYLHAEKIASVALQTELVFMSACHSGRGNLKKEGVIGPNWSFLAAGAKSTIAAYWPLPESDLTVRMVETFYQYLLGDGVKKCNKAEALREAMLMAIKEKSTPRNWAAFFLSGLAI